MNRNGVASAPAAEAKYNRNLSYPGDRGLWSEVTEFKNRPSPLVKTSVNGTRSHGFDTDVKRDASAGMIHSSGETDLRGVGGQAQSLG